MKQAVAQKDARAWLGEALERFERPLTAYARRFTGDLDAARDIVQDAFLKLCQRPFQPNDPRLGPWLFRVCRNRAIDRLRKEGPVRLWAEPDRVPAPPSAGGAESAAEHRDEALRLAEGVRALPPRQGEAVWLKFHADLSYRQIAEVMDVSVANVGYLLHTALGSLRRRLARVPATAALRKTS
jgi:RNA polymerase sigma-70 factor (ECF subfamily)